MESEKLLCKYDSTWEEEGDDEEEEAPSDPQERQKNRWIITWILYSFVWAWLAKVINWIPWRWFLITGRKNEGKNGSEKKRSHHTNKGTVRHRNLRAAQDMQTYRHEYPDLEDEDCLENPNLDFYMNLERFQPNGVKIEELLQTWKEDYELLEKSHSYIQWLFPLREAGMNWCAQPLSRKELEAFRKSDEVKKRFVQAYKLMLDFYGIELVNEKTGELQRAPHFKERFQNLNWHSHNNLRITRILKCLGEMGYEHFQVKLVKFFLEETLIKGTLPSVKQSALDYFLFTVRDRQSRRNLVHYAWQNYNPQDRFVWGPLEKLKRFKVPKSAKQSSIRSTAKEVYTETSTVGESAQPESLLETTTMVGCNKTVSVESSDGKAKLKGEPSEDAKKVAGPAVQDHQSAQIPEELTVENASESKAINHDKAETTVEQLLPEDGLLETLKEVRKRKLSVTEQEEPVKTLQMENLSSNISGPPNEDFREECTDSSAAGTVLPALKKKKEDAKEPLNVSLEKETNPNKGCVPVPAVKEEVEKMLPVDPKDECVGETIQPAGNVEGNVLDQINVCAPVEKCSGKCDLSIVKGRCTKIGQESGVAVISKECIEKHDIEAYQENSDRNEQITESDVASHEGVEQLKDVYKSSIAQVEKNNIASLSLVPLAKTEDHEPGKVFEVNEGKSSEEAVRISDFHEDVPDQLRVCHSVLSKKRTHAYDDNTSNTEAYQELGSTEKSIPNEQKSVSDVKSAMPDENEHIKAPKNESGGLVKHDLKGERERKSHDFASEVQEKSGTVEQQESCSTQSADALDVNKTITELVDCRLPVASGAERLQSLNELQNCQAQTAASEVKDLYGSTEQEACKAALAANEVIDKPALMQLVDCKPVQAPDEVNERKGLAQLHSRDCTPVAREVEDCSGITVQQDCKCEQTADGHDERELGVKEQLFWDSILSLCTTNRFLDTEPPGPKYEDNK